MTEYQFKIIQNSDPFVSLQKDIIIPKHNEIVYSAIFQYTKPELDQVKNDVLRIFNTISKDVFLEMKQNELLDSKLKKTYKHLRHTYKKVSDLRTKNAKYPLKTNNVVYSKHLNFLDKSVNKCENELSDVKWMSDNIIENIITINNKFIKDGAEPVLSLDNLNEQQYPILFKILKERHPEVTTQRIKNRSKQTLINEAEIIHLENNHLLNEVCSNSIPFSSKSEETQITLKNTEDSNADKNSNGMDYGVNQTKFSTTFSNMILPPLIPLYLHKKSVPSTFTTLQNINGEKIIEKEQAGFSHNNDIKNNSVTDGPR